MTQVYAQAETLGLELEAFAEHAGRSRIQVEDVMLHVRNNPTLVRLFALMSGPSGLTQSFGGVQKELLDAESVEFGGQIPGEQSK